MSKDYIPYDQVPAPETTADRRKRAFAQGPVILYGKPSPDEIAEARGHAGSRGILVLPEALRDVEMHTDAEWLERRKAATGRGRERERLLTDDGQELDLDQPAPDLDPEQHFGHEREQAEQDRIAREDGIVDITRHTEDTLFKAASAAQKITDPQTANDIINEMLNAGILFREPAPDYDAVRESTEAHIREVYFDGEGAEVDTRTDAWMGEEATMAEEPIEQRLRRAFLNGFKEGVDRASNVIEGWGRWDA